MTQLHYPDVTLAALPPSMAAMYPHRAAVVEGDRTLDYSELDSATASIAAGLRARGVRERDVVALHLPNSIEFVLAYYGSLRAGATVTLVNPAQPAKGLRDQLAETDAVGVFTTGDSRELVTAAVDGTDASLIVVVDGPTSGDATAISLDELAEPTHDGPPQLRITGDDVAHLAFTGGTTGVSKGVRVLHRNVIANATQMIAWRAGHSVVDDDRGLVHLEPRDGGNRGVRPGDAATVVVSPLFHAHALINMSFLLMCGASQVLAVDSRSEATTRRFDAGRMLELIERHRATYVTGSPAMWASLVGHPDVGSRDLSSVRVVSSGAAPIDRVTLDRLAAAFPSCSVVEGYGLTEATCLVTSAPLADTGQGAGDYRIGSVGLPTYDTQLQIRSLADRTTILSTGERGGLWVRGPQVTAGCLHHPEITAQQFVDGWLDTGDIAFRDDDGHVYIADRAKDMLIYKGYNVYPRELEEILVTHPDVAQAAVVAREAGVVGQEPVAFVVARDGREVDVDAVMTYVAEQVLPYKKIRDVVVIDALPTSAAGKIQKVALRTRLRESEELHHA
ncbi:acyl--CoA ligase [Gordonia sputi]|uniref:class I adenylate-forming enzyme family protein n=1 Tax=Gordonia sputi TaxID=36823 RepID=UPI0020435F45|nr:class I adenylate-forming enzyme family protein [Gordonia sputi]MCM3894779.1 acyl--CoA ligase [Gordonia sputi]